MTRTANPGTASPQASSEIEIREGLEGVTPGRVAVLYRRAPLLRPVSDPSKLRTMFERASLVLTAWKGSRLVGIARVLSDGVLYSFLVDLAVEPDVQGLGIGRLLVLSVLERCRGTDLLVRGNLGRLFRHEGLEVVTDAWMVPAKRTPH